MTDPTRRRLWLVTAAILGAVSIGVFIWIAPLNAGIAVAGVCAVVLLLAVMAVVAVQVARARPRNLAFAVVTLTMVVVVSALLLTLVAFPAA